MYSTIPAALQRPRKQVRHHSQETINNIAPRSRPPSSGEVSKSSSCCSSIHESWEENHRTFKIVVRLDGRVLRRSLIELPTPGDNTTDDQSIQAYHQQIDPDSSTQAAPQWDRPVHVPPGWAQHTSSVHTCSDNQVTRSCTQVPGGDTCVTTREVRSGHLPPGGSSDRSDLNGSVSLEEDHYDDEEDGDKEVEDDSLELIAYVARNIAVSVLLGYQRLLQQACVYGVLMREVHGARAWVRHTMEEADRLFVQRRRDMYHPHTYGRDAKSPGRGASLPEKYLIQLKDLLDDVLEHKSAIESLIRESWSYLDHDPDTLLYFDIADIDSTWQRLKDKLRRLGARPWTSRTQLCELNNYFAARKERQEHHPKSRRHFEKERQKERHQQKGRRQLTGRLPKNPPTLVDPKNPTRLDSLPCSLSVSISPQFSSSSSFVDDVGEETITQCISGIISSDFEFSSEKSFCASESPLPEIPVLSSLSTVPEEESFYDSDLVSPRRFKATTEDQRTLLNLKEALYNLREGSSLPDLSFCSQSHVESCRPKTRSHETQERIFYRNTYSSSSIASDFTLPSSESFLNSSDPSLLWRDATGSRSSSHGSHFRSSDAFQLSRRHLSASDGNLLVAKAHFPSSLCDVTKMEVLPTMSKQQQPLAANGAPRSGRSTPSSGRNSPLGVRPATPPGVDDSPVLQKRRRMNHELPVSISGCGSDVLSVSGGSSPRDSPASLHLMLNPGMTMLPFNVSNASFDDTFDDLSDGQLSGQEMSPSVQHSKKRERLHGKYRKDELWAAIQSDYHYLMDGEIIETCKSTESDLSWESDDLLAQTKVSFTEFMQQYKELTEWLNHIQMMTQRQSASLSEKYLNQTYHEEMLQRSPRRKVFNDYAKQLMRRYPSMRDEISIRLQHLNGQWETLEKVISAGGATRDEQTMLRDLEQDLNGLRTWLHDVESRLLPLCVHPHWNTAELEAKLKEHQVLQRDIESHSKIVSAVLKLCEHLQSDKNACSNEVEKDSLQLVAINLERRWHAIWLQSLEWQCRLEEAITRGNGLHSTRINDDDWGARFGFSKTTTVNITHHDFSDGQSSCDEELSELIDSDHSNSDIIPFSENEYEKITVDTDCQTDPADDGQLSPGSSKGSGCSSGMDPAIDSALGRSVSDHSINNDHLKSHIACQSALRITTDQVNRAVNKVVSFAKEAEMRGYEGSKARERTKRVKGKGDHDIGYSSESHSNDEPDFGCKPLAGDQEVPNDTSVLEVPREGSPDGPVERPRSLDTIVLRRGKSPCEGSSEENAADSGTMPSPVTPDKSWRHSMTSAYETSSQCSASRSNSPFDLNATLETTGDASICTTIDLRGDADLENESYSSIQDLMSSSSQSFYVMTSVESDAETAGSTRPASELNITTGEDPDREGGDENSEDEPRTAVQSPNVFDSPEKYMSGLEQSTPVKGIHDALTGSRTGSPGGFRCTPIKGHEVQACGVDSERARSDSLIPQIDSEASAREAALSSDDVEPPRVEEERRTRTPPHTRNSISKLVLQAELMVREGDLAPPANKVRRRRKGRSSKHRLAAIAPIDSYTDTSTHHTDSPVSSCDASCESESEGETSATSGADQRPLVGGTGTTGLQKFHTLPRAKCDQRHNEDHTCSVTQLYELSNRLDLAPFSISESAIDCAATARKVRRLNSTPYRKRKLMPRSASYDCEQTLSTSPLGGTRGFSSMPGSRQQSSQEWMQHAHTSPEQSPSAESVLQKWPSREDKERLQAVQTACQVLGSISDTDMTEAPKPVADSDNEPAWRSVFNTTGEFSENAWDPYQDPLYNVTSDDPTEAKLDPLGFDNDLEYDQYFHLDSSFGCDLPRPDTQTRSREKRTSVTASYRDLQQEDSDSDLEELQHVVEESRKQIGVAETVLDNHHKDGLGTGLYLDPSPYTELVATCQTNIKCLEVLCDTIDSGDLANSTITDDDLQVIQDVIDRWSELHELAVQRQYQSRELAGLAREVVALKTAVNDAGEEVEQLSRFDDVGELETAVKDLQARSMELSMRRSTVEGLQEAVRQFAAANPTINMSGFATEIQDLSTDLNQVKERCGQQVSALKSSLMAWYDFRETTKELSYLVGRDRHQLQCLAVTHDVIAVCLADAVDTVHDLKLMKSEFELYESKLWSLRTLSADILPVCDETSAADIRNVVTTMDADVSSISLACDDLIDALEEKVKKQGGGVLLYPETMTSEAEMRDAEKAERRSPSPRMTEAERPSLLWRIFRIAMPLHLTLVVILGLAYLLDPESFSIFISPQLRYVRGPPPV